MRLLDDPILNDLDQNGFVIILKSTTSLVKDVQSFPSQVLVERWSNSRVQLTFLRYAIQLAPELFTMSQSIKRRVIPLDIVNNNSVIRSIVNIAATSSWNSLDLIQTLIEIGEGPLNSEVKMLFEIGIQQAPDLILLAFAQLQLSVKHSF